MLKKVSKKFGGLEKGFYLCTVLEIRHDSGCSAVGSVQRSGRWGRQFESGHSDQVLKNRSIKGRFFLFSCSLQKNTILIRCGGLLLPSYPAAVIIIKKMNKYSTIFET